MSTEEYFKKLFNWKTYVGKYKDLQKNGVTEEHVWYHANQYGWKENRIIFTDNNLQKDFLNFKNNNLDISNSNNNEKNNKLIEEGIDMYNLNNLTHEYINKISKNVHRFSDQIKPYKNILFISGDYPGYGGAATNCYELQKYFNTLGHNTFGFYFNYETGTIAKHEIHDDHIIDDVYNLKSIEFKPDIIILKSPIVVDLKSIFNCPVYYLIGGIYKNDLDKYYYDLDSKEENNKYINKEVLNHISKYDQSFVNSQHTAYVLKKFYGVTTNIFYSSFVPFVDKKVLIDPDFEKRKYHYGLIISNFDRKIKNVEKSIEFLKDKENVILIGRGSEKYKSYGFTCIGLVDKEEIDKYYKQIKYIVQDSYYESCSNVKIEGLFNGCSLIKKYNQYNVVVSSTQYPGYGGAATNAYHIIKFLRKNGLNTAGVFFHNRLDVNYDPDEIGGIFLYLSNKYEKNTIRNDVKSYLKREPNYCLAKNYRAPYFCKQLFNCYTVYLVSGINHFRCFYPTTSALELLEDSFIIDENNSISEEINTCNLCDSIIVNSELTHKIFTKIYPEYVYKLKQHLDTTFCIKQLEKTFEKEYDIVIICSNFKRQSKNYLFLLNVLKNEIFNNYKKLIIGENSDIFEGIENVTFLPLQLHEHVIEYMAKSKILLHPALYESNSNTIREAYYHKCLPMITRNVGYNELFPEYLICENFTPTEWIDKVKWVLDNYNDVKGTIIKFNTTLDIDKLLL
jgi:hypothetical protein